MAQTRRATQNAVISPPVTASASQSQVSLHAHAACVTHYYYYYYMNACRAPRVEMSPKRFTMVTILRHSQLSRTPTALQLSVMQNECIVSLHSADLVFFFFFFFFTALRRCLVVTWLASHETAAVSAHVLCTPYSQPHVYSMILFKATYRSRR